MESADGKGRSLWQIVTGQNQKTPEPELYNPLQAKVGNSVTFAHDLRLSGINFFIEEILVYETEYRPSEKFYETEYALKGLSLSMSQPLRLRLRVIPDKDASQDFPFRLQCLYLYDESKADQGLTDYLNTFDMEEGFTVNLDDVGNELLEPRKYWRVNDVRDPYGYKVTILRDTGVLVENREVTFWDLARVTYDHETSQDYTEFLNVIQDNETGYLTFFRGRSVEPFQVMII